MSRMPRSTPASTASTASTALLATEHAALVEDLRTLTDDQWAAPSLCAEWTVHQVVAHLGAVLTGGWAGWAAAMIRARLRPAVYNRIRIARFIGEDPPETLARFAAIGADDGPALRPATRRPAPWLGELIVHSQDIRRPLGLASSPRRESLLVVADFFASRDYTVRSRSQVAGLRLRATDADFIHGDPGRPEISGPLAALVMVMAGRPAYAEDLAGDGLEELRLRLG